MTCQCAKNQIIIDDKETIKMLDVICRNIEDKMDMPVTYQVVIDTIVHNTFAELTRHEPINDIKRHKT